jgi:predicted dehydrogenase
MAIEDGRITRWGIIGTGGIATAFAKDLVHVHDAELVAVGSRSLLSADTFGDQFEIAHRHPSYEALVADDDVDAVYVSTPHPMHHAAAMLAINAGKAVLVEKPFTISAAEASSLIDAARANGTFLMEAMWTRFLPHIDRVRQILADGGLGDVRSVTAEHGQWFEDDPEFRLFNPDLGGGALLDLGIYPVSFASMVFGTPTTITAVSEPAFTGVDAITSLIFGYDGGQQSILTTTLETATENNAAINGTEARIEIAGTFYAPSTYRVVARDGTIIEEYNEFHEGHGLYHQAAEVGRCLREGLTESPLLPLSETLSIMETMDKIREQIGLVYPFEK